nr:glycerol-3-phosphate dehydrogenase [Oceanospirillaceae bacterium]
KLEAQFPHMGPPWTQRAPLPGGDFLLAHKAQLKQQLQQKYPFLSSDWAQRLINTYGTNANNILGAASCSADLGLDFGHTLSQAEVQWLQQHEFAKTAEDIVWRRTKLGLVLNQTQIDMLSQWLDAH